MFKTFKRLCASLLAAALILAFMTGCGEAPPESAPPESEEAAGAEALVFAVAGPDKWIARAAEDYNAAGPEKPVELLRFQSAAELMSAVDGGLEADMYFAALDGLSLPEYAGSPAARLWEASADLSGRLDIPLAGNLAEAMSCEGELRCLPFDFEVEGVAWTLGEALPGSMAEAEALAAGAGATLFYPLWNCDSLAGGWLYPYLCSADEAARGDILASVLAHEQDDEPAPDARFAFNLVRLDGDENGELGLGNLVFNCADGWAAGLPGAETAGIYVPKHVFGIFEGCSDADAAWAFLEGFLSDALQENARSLPAAESAFESRLEHASRFVSPEAVETARGLVENSRLAAGPGLAGEEQAWYVEYINSEARHEKLGIA